MTPPGQREDRAIDEAELDVLEQRANRADVGLTTERERARERLSGTYPDADQQGVVVDPDVAAGSQAVVLRTDGDERPEMVACVAAGGTARQVEAQHFTDRKGLGNRERAVEEVPIRRNEGDLDAFLRQSPHRDHRFERRNAAPRDDDLKRTAPAAITRS